MFTCIVFIIPIKVIVVNTKQNLKDFILPWVTTFQKNKMCTHVRLITTPQGTTQQITPSWALTGTPEKNKIPALLCSKLFSVGVV